MPAKLNFNTINIMGVINTTPDSFSDGGQFLKTEAALKHAQKLIKEGADILDIGGESTRPGAKQVSIQEELDRTIPVIQGIRQFSEIPISIDTSKPQVMLAAAQAGVDMINDVYALQLEGALEAAATTKLPVCLMHMQGNPLTMQQNPEYENVVETVIQFLQLRINAAQAAGITRENLIIDPGFGFGKTLQQNLQLLNSLSDFKVLDLPLLIGISRKSMLGLILDKPVEDRIYASLSAAVIAAQAGADIIRVHDVNETRDALAVVQALRLTDPL